MNIEARDFARMGYFHPSTLLEIAKDSFKSYEQHLKELDRLMKIGSFTSDGVIIYDEQEEIMTTENEIKKDLIKSIIFLNSFLESYFFELSDIVLGASYTKNHIEKMDLLSKIAIIPKLAFGKEFDRSKHYWSSLKSLVKWRNKIIHAKTKNAFSKTEEVNNNFKFTKSRSLIELINITSLFDSVKELFEDLDKIDPEGFHTFRLERHY